MISMVMGGDSRGLTQVPRGEGQGWLMIDQPRFRKSSTSPRVAGFEPRAPTQSVGRSSSPSLRDARLRYTLAKVRVVGFEPTLSCSQGRRIGHAFPHPESSCSLTSAQRESNPHVRHGEAVGCRYIMGTFTVPRIVKERAPGGTRTHVAALRVRCPGRWTTSASAFMGSEGLEPSPARLRAATRHTA